ncbi:universal stress protein [Streptomyces atriruber]|uniref:universal stress protein n=1 Tax=Streptomyces atriruber TaxID=545121 RepID=UPI0007C6DF6C|nr:universal stress protein [Streptomyces atriruber]
MSRSVVAGIDGRPESLAAADWAAREAVYKGRPLLLVHAWSRSPYSMVSVAANTAQRAEAERVLNAAADRIARACPGLRVKTDQVEGPAVTALSRLADGAELLALGRRTKRSPAGLPGGSVARGVISRVERPVALVRAGEGQGRSAHVPRTGDVVLGVDLGNPCAEAIGFAFEEARLRRCGLRVVHAWSDPPTSEGEATEIGLVEAEHREEERSGLLTAVLKVRRGEYPEVPVIESVRRGKASSTLLRDTDGADLLVVGHRLGAHPYLGLHSSPTVHAVMQHARCPVVVVPHY